MWVNNFSSFFILSIVDGIEKGKGIIAPNEPSASGVNNAISNIPRYIEYWIAHY